MHLTVITHHHYHSYHYSHSYLLSLSFSFLFVIIIIIIIIIIINIIIILTLICRCVRKIHKRGEKDRYSCLVNLYPTHEYSWGSLCTGVKSVPRWVMNAPYCSPVCGGRGKVCAGEGDVNKWIIIRWWWWRRKRRRRRKRRGRRRKELHTHMTRYVNDVWEKEKKW